MCIHGIEGSALRYVCAELCTWLLQWSQLIYPPSHRANWEPCSLWQQPVTEGSILTISHVKSPQIEENHTYRNMEAHIQFSEQGVGGGNLGSSVTSREYFGKQEYNQEGYLG